LLVCFPFVAISAQEWDEVSAEELEMTSLAEDPEAAAVVLFAIGDLKIGRSSPAGSFLKWMSINA
jgi:hypothetical protein